MSDPIPPGRDVPEGAAGWAAPVPPPGGAGSGEPAVWGLSEPPPSLDPGAAPTAPPPPASAAGFQGAAPPPPAPFPTGRGGAPRGLTRRRKTSGVGVLAGLAILAARIIGGMTTGSSDGNDFTPVLPQRDEGPPVAAETLTSDQLCALLRPAALERIYGVPFQPGDPIGSTPGSPAPTGEPSDQADVAACAWQSEAGGNGLVVNAFAVPSIGGDANATYELLRPESPIQGFDATSDIGDEAFFLVGSFDDGDRYSDSMTLRQGGVVITFGVAADTKPDGGLDLLAEVGQVAADHLAAQG